MLPEEKAKELISKIAPKCSGNSQEILNHELAKQCSIILCDEFIEFAEEGCWWDMKDEWTLIREHIEQL